MEDEIILPSGPFAGESYRHSRHPISRLWFNALESRLWSRFAASGPTQNGKTLMCYVGPVLYHLFEVGETVIVGLPSMDMANDKWTADFLPVIRASRYFDLLPLRGEGSRGGQVRRAIDFRNGATLRFMTAGGSDKKRAGFTSRVLAVTETDGMDESGETSREADKIEQLEGRTRAFGRTGKRVYLECTVSIERGRIWQEIKRGTDTRVARPCPHCGIYVTPERDHLLGWRDAGSEEEAADKAHWICPSCDEPWTEHDRLLAAEKGVLVHRGQEVTDDGSVTGPIPRTQTLGLRWSAIDNPFVTAADLGAEEWLSSRAKDRDNSEKKMRQFVWAIPYEPPEVDLTPLDYETVICRVTELRKGIEPTDSAGIAVGIDTGKRTLHWEAKAARTNGSMPIIEYGTQTVEADKLGVYQGLLAALRELRKYLEGGLWKPSQVWIDSGYHEHTDAVYAFCAEANKGLAPGQERYRPSKGYGEGQVRTGRYIIPNHKSADIIYVGKEFYIAKVRRNGKLLPGVQLVHVNSDHWKSELHQRLAMPPTEPGAVTIYKVADAVEHSTWAAHQVAEKQVEKFIVGRGNVIVWERLDRANHLLYAGYAATAGCQFILDMINKPRQTKPEDRPTARDLAEKARRL
jgi:phage terminase large subunit GpA-like protein